MEDIMVWSLGVFIFNCRDKRLIRGYLFVFDSGLMGQIFFFVSRDNLTIMSRFKMLGPQTLAAQGRQKGSVALIVVAKPNAKVAGTLHAKANAIASFGSSLTKFVVAQCVGAGLSIIGANCQPTQDRLYPRLSQRHLKNGVAFFAVISVSYTHGLAAGSRIQKSDNWGSGRVVALASF